MKQKIIEKKLCTGYKKGKRKYRYAYYTHAREKGMSQIQVRTRHTTSRKELLHIMRESYLFDSDKQARYALGAVCAALRAWLNAMTDSPKKGHLTSLRIPGFGTLRVGWVEYPSKRHSPTLSVKFRPIRTIARRLEGINRAEYAAWRASVPGTEK